MATCKHRDCYLCANQGCEKYVCRSCNPTGLRSFCDSNCSTAWNVAHCANAYDFIGDGGDFGPSSAAATPASATAAAPASAATAPAPASAATAPPNEYIEDEYVNWDEDEIVKEIFPGGNVNMLQTEIEKLREELGLDSEAKLTFNQVFSIRLFRMHIFFYFIYHVYEALNFSGFDPIDHVDHLITWGAIQRLRTIERKGGMLPYFREPFLDRWERIKNYCRSNNIKKNEMYNEYRKRYY